MNQTRLFRASCVALIVTAMSFALRGGATGDWVTQFKLTNEQVGWVNGTAFWGFTLAMMFGGPLVDTLGFKRILGIAFVGHLAGILLTIFAWDFWSLFLGTLLFGIANGSVEAACNPLVATLYPKDQTTRLNNFHVWFPGGIVIGGLMAYFFGKLGLGWQAQFATMLVPLAAYGFLFIGQEFPQTERVQRGESTGSMFAACVAPGFILMVACMLMTASTELGSGQWIPNILSHAGVDGILVLVWINGLMAVGRQFAGVFVHKLSPIGMLVGSAILSTARPLCHQPLFGRDAVCCRHGVRVRRVLLLADHGRLRRRELPEDGRSRDGHHRRRGHAEREHRAPDHRPLVRQRHRCPNACRCSSRPVTLSRVSKRRPVSKPWARWHSCRRFSA